MTKDTAKRVTIFFTGLLINLYLFTLVAAKVPPDKDLSVSLTLDEWKYILGVMSKEPKRDVDQLYRKMEVQLINQLNDSIPKPPAKPKN